MSLAVAAEIGEAILAKNVTAAEATLGTLALEGARYGGDAVRKSYNKLRRRSFARGPRASTVNKLGKLGKRVRERFAPITPIKSKRQKRQHDNTIRNRMETEGEAARFGERPSLAVAKQKGSGYGPDPNSTNIVYDVQIAYPTKGTDINERPNDQIYLKGLKYCANIKNTLAAAQGSYFCNFAIVSRKDNVSSGSQMEVSMFRSREGTRGQNFEDTSEAIDRHCLPLNTDKYHVWVHKRFKLRGEGTNMPGSKMFSGYLPINRQIRFTGANQPNGELSAIWWFGKENTLSQAPFSGTQDPGFQPVEALAFNTNMAFTLYWDDPISSSMLRQAMKSMKRRKYKRRSKSRGPYRGYQ